MPDGLEARLRWLFGGVAVVLVATGAYALLVTSTTEPAQAAIDVQRHALVTALLAAAIATFAALGARIAWAPRRSTHLMPVLALATSAATVLETLLVVRAWRDGAPLALPAGVAAASGTLALASALGWLALWLAPRPGDATARRDALLLDALLDTLLPPDQGLALDGGDALVRARIADAFAARSTRRRPALRLALRTLDVLALVKHRTSFARAAAATREAIVAGLAVSRRARLRALNATLDEIVLGTFWSDGRVRHAVGDDATRVALLLESGPNAALHRARRAAAERAAEEAARAAEELARAAAPDDAPDAAAVAAPGAALAVAHAADAATPGVTAAAEVEVAPAPVPAPPADTARKAPAATRAPATPSAATPTPPAAAAPPASRTSATAPPAGRTPAPAPGDGPKELAVPGDEVPFDRPWTLGVPPQEAAVQPVLGPVLRVARASGPTRR